MVAVCFRAGRHQEPTLSLGATLCLGCVQPECPPFCPGIYEGRILGAL